MEMILASKSPRRREILNNMGITDFAVIPAEGEEAASGATPGETVEKIARGKALAVASDHPDAVVIAADTLVYLDGEPLGKPRDTEDAFNMLRRLSGREHEVYTGVCVTSKGKIITEHERTSVRFRPLSDKEITGYIATGEPMDKAGAYGVQGQGCLLVEGITGDFFNVMGLPACRLHLMLKKLLGE